MSGPLAVGVDIGTQSVKAALFDVEGTCLAEASQELVLRRSGADEVDQEPEDFYRATTSTIAACVERSRCDPGGVAGVGIAGQMAGVLGIDAEGRAVTPYDSWLDSRCRPQVEEIAERLGDTVVRLTGCPPMVAHAPKIVWWSRRHPDVHASVAKYLVPSAFVAGRLCGLGAEDAFVDVTHLHFTGLVDAAAGVWSAELAEELDVDLQQLPRIVAPTERVGALTATAARDCGLLAGTPVAGGLGDTAAGALGAGLVAPGQLLDTAGTASVLGISTTAFRPDLASRTLVLMRGAVPGQWISLAYLAGGDLLRWLPQALGAPLEQLIEEAATAEGGGLLFVPHLGGRILPAAPAARGAWVGLDFSHARGDLVRSALESVAFEYALFLEHALELYPDVVPLDVRVIGGGRDDRLWNRIKAAAVGLPYERLARENFSCWGVALVAAASVGAVDDLAAAALGATAVRERVEPDARLRVLYGKRLRDYRALIEQLVPSRQKVTA